ncbi:MAG: hypothetical protein CL610_23970 [Anaerolineaceae bacterium]|nr:hypothetical protein [Anaerolineaceae bacterium]
MSYFTFEDHNLVGADTGSITRTDVYQKFLNLHDNLRDKLRCQDYDLHGHPQKARALSTVSTTATAEPNQTLSLAYFRPYEQARMVESQMGLEINPGETGIEPQRHPVIELRLAPDYFAIELVVSPNAWWDQINFISKIDLQRHRETLRRTLYRLDADYRFGFWGGENLSDMHLTIWQLLHGRVLDEWMDTFADSQDWLRLGVWYEPESPQLSADYIIHEAATRIGELYKLYDFMLWTSNNDYHQFYQKRDKYARRMYA